MSSSQRKPGRPREQDVDQRIIAATLHLMAQYGYVRMSLDAVAAEAGVTKPTIYRRYASKEHLAVAALSAYRQHNLPTNTGDTRADLIAHLRHFQTGVARPFGMAMIGTVLAEEFETPELLHCFREQVVQPRRTLFRQILQRGQARGEFSAHADISLAVTMLVGSYYAHYLAGDSFEDNWCETIVDTVLAGLRCVGT